MKKKELTYYDMGGSAAAMFKPIDEYLGMTKRFSPKAKKKTLIGYLAMVVPFQLLAIFMLICIINTKDMEIGIKLICSLIPLVFIGFLSLAIKYLISTYKEPHQDMLTCRNILDRDGIETVYKDFAASKYVCDRVRVGEKYLFIEGQTVVRIKDIIKADLEIARGDEDGGIYYMTTVRDELGERKYRVRNLTYEMKLTGLLRDFSEAGMLRNARQTQTYIALDAAISERRKKLETLDIEGLPES